MSELQKRLEEYGLTRREREVVRLLMRGYAVENIAAQLGISPHTVRGHLKSVFHKTGTHRQTQLIALLANESTQLDRIEATVNRIEAILTVGDAP